MIKKVFGNSLLVEPRAVEEVTSAGIFVPTAKGQKQQIGKVIAIGSGYILDNGTRMPLEVNVGDIVVFEKYAGTTIQDNGKDYIVLNEKDLLVQLEE